MVEFRAPSHDDDNDDDNNNVHDTLDDHGRDVQNISTAYRHASDEDTRNVMNAMSNPTPENLNRLKFYAVPASWLVKVWPMLSYRPDLLSVNEIPRKEQVGKILNARLVIDAERDSSEEDDRDRKPAAIKMNGNYGCSNTTNFDQAKANMERFHRRQVAQNAKATKMKPGLQHAKHFFFLGERVWDIVKMKFGYDGYEICRTSCKATTTSGRTYEEQGTIAIALLPGEGMYAGSVEANSPAAATVSLPSSSTTTTTVETVVIPATGRFPYEKILPTLTIDDEDDPVLGSLVGGSRNDNVVSWANNGDLGDSKVEEDRIILLPASSTPIQQPVSSPLFTDRMHDMDLDSKSHKDSICGDGVQVSGRKRLASGLSNLGNTCFMNSTLQCLSNTENLRRYFLSGDYLKDLNTDNPLGTGGQLATQFARLLGEMWGVPSKRRNILGHSSYTGTYSHTYNSAVMPRDFKACVGRHAEQFMGYDQHDSQEFATYLLDALHEDTNRVTKKPYIEKPEQGEDEPDDVAAEKAWKLHLQREDSHVLENFMGQVKSRLECCEPGCNRVSTTFDPFMYLSVPIPGSTERTVKLTFVPLDPNKKGQIVRVKVSKIGKISDLLDKMNEKLSQLGYQEHSIPLHDLAVVDVWNHEIFKWRGLNDDVVEIQKNDNTVVYQLPSLEEITLKREVPDIVEKWESKITHRVFLDLQTKTKLDTRDKWMDALQDYSRKPRFVVRCLNPHMSGTEQRMEFHKKLENFLDECHKVLEKEESGGLKRARETFDGNDSSDGIEMEDSDSGKTDPIVQELVDRCTASDLFCNVKTKHDFAVLEFCANKLRQMILQTMKDEKSKRNEGLLVQISFPKRVSPHHEEKSAPLILRIPGTVTVYEFRQMIADRIARSLDASRSTDNLGTGSVPMSSGEMSEETNEMNTGEPSSEAEAAERSQNESVNEPPLEESVFLILRRAELRCEREGIRSSRFGNDSRLLGVVQKDSDSKLAMPSDQAEQATMDTVGNHAHITIRWDEEYRDNVFNQEEFESVDDLRDNSFTKKQEDPITVLDCIKKYCQKEQLEESEMWYCNKCKNHVRAWKQFHLHRTPPYLIVHLKRFYFSASSRRRDKISDFIDFPLKGLDLTELIADYNESTKPIYDCYAVSNHIGGLGGGHYTAYILSDDGESWSYYNDSSVTENYDKEEVVSAEAYVLYYRRRDVPVGQDREYRFTTNSRQPSPMICETVSPIDQRSETSSNQAVDMDATLDDVVSNSSSGAATSPMGSVDHVILGEEDLYSDDIQTDEQYPLQ